MMQPCIAPARHLARPRHLGPIALFLIFGLAAACATKSYGPPHLPPISPEASGLELPGKMVWVDLVTRDAEEAMKFYGELFGWTFEREGRYTRVVRGGETIAGIVVPLDPDWTSAEWVPNFSVVDVDRATRLIGERGGVIERAPVDAPSRGRLSMVSDPQGAFMLLVRASGGDPADRDPELAEWLWAELWTHDVDASVALYQELVGYEAETRTLREAPYTVLKRDGVPRAGIIQAPDQVNPLWLPYVRVADTASIAARAEALGARVVLQNESTAIMVDPTGAPIGVQVWSRRAGETP